MPDLTKYYIGGRWVEPLSQRRFPVINPATEQQFAEIILANEADVDTAVAAARSAFEADFGATKEERLRRLRRLLEVTEKRLEDLAQAMTREMGAPIRMSREAQADAAVGHLKGFIEALEDQQEEEALANGDTLVREPIGVCGLITPWNWPINQIALKVIPALAAGATCILKPSEHTPLSAVLYAEIIDAAGFPAGAFNSDPGRRRDGRRGLVAASGHSNDVVHRIDAGRASRDQGCSRNDQACHPGTRRKITQPGVCGLRPRGTDQPERARVLPQHGPVL